MASGAGATGNDGAGARTAHTTMEEIAFGRLHRPLAATSCPGLVLIHDVWGRSEHSRALAARMAGEGFAVVELDLYRELAEPEVRDAGERIRSLDDGRVLDDVDAAGRWLAAQPVCRGRRIGVMGVCMGGTYSLLAACRSTVFSAAAPFYAVLSYERGLVLGEAGRDRRRKPVSPIEAAPSLRMPLLASFGGRDEFVPDSDVDVLEAALPKSGSEFRVDRYRAAGHAFLNETRPGAYRPEEAAIALERTIAFFHARLD